MVRTDLLYQHGEIGVEARNPHATAGAGGVKTVIRRSMDGVLTALIFLTHGLEPV